MTQPRQWLVAFAVLVMLAVPAVTAPAASSASIRQRVYYYLADGRTQIDIPCGSTSPSSRVYVDLTVQTYGTLPAYQNAVYLNGTRLWRQETNASGGSVFGSRYVGRYFQLLSGGRWTFEATLGSAARSLCTIYR